MPSESPSIFSPGRRDPAIEIKPERLAPISSVDCPECRGHHTTRCHRRTFFQKAILYRLGYYPWKCIDCSYRFLSKDRGHR